MLASPRRPSRTIRIFSSAEYCLRVARRMVFTSRSDGELPVTDFCLICAPRRATMSQKSSLPQLAKSVSMALIPDTADTIDKSFRWIEEQGFDATPAIRKALRDALL